MIPNALKDRPHWVVWRYETRQGKRTKVPYQPNGRRAESNNPDTWSDYETVSQAAHNYSGIGIMCADGLAGLDLDHCIVDGSFTQQAQDFIGRMNTYTEVTPSGEGVRCLFFGTLPETGRKKGNIEVYNSGRFFTVTGNHVEGTPETVEEREREIRAIHAEIFGGKKSEPVKGPDDDLIKMLNSGVNDPDLSRLWKGDTRDYGSQSEAELAFCAKLAQWTQERVRIDRLYRASKLYRPKWDERHYANGQTYGEHTLDKALEEKPAPDFSSIPEDEAPPQDDAWGNPYTLEDAYIERPPVVYIVNHILAEETVNMVYGDSGSLKSMILSDLCVCVASGRNWLMDAHGQGGIEVSPSPVMWIDYDNGARRSHNRFGALARSRNLTPAAPIYYYSMAQPQLEANQTEHIAALRWRIVKRGVRLLVVDNLSLVSGSADENSRDMAHVIAGFRFLSENTGVCVVIVHHQNKPSAVSRKTGDLLRGHSSIKAGLDVALYVLRDGDEENRSNDVFISAPKVRDGDIEPFAARFEYTSLRQNELTTARFVGIDWKDTGERSTEKTEEKIIAHLTNCEEPIGKNALHDAVGGRYRQFGETIDRMIASGKIVRTLGAKGKIILELKK